MQITYRYLCSRESRTGIETDTIPAGATVHFDFPGVRLEVLGRIFGGDTALDSKTTFGDVILSQAKLGKGCTSCDLNLGRNDVDTSNLL